MSQPPKEIVKKEITGLHRITQKRLRELCKKNKLYQTPELNDTLYLHFQGFQYIECLEEYTELKCLWLESNAIGEIQGLENQKKLKCLFLQNNLIRKIENLEHCIELDTLNLSSNHIRKIENCGVNVLPVLSSLNLSTNYLKDAEALQELKNCHSLSVLDLSNNRIDDILVVKIFSKMPQLKVLVLTGNPVVSRIPQYRKTLILECKELTYLDSRPVFDRDRACAEAWKIGGYDAERKEHTRWNRREQRKIRDSVNATIRLRNRHRPPEDQLELISSSGSDSESKEEKRKAQEDIWDEVDDSKPTEIEPTNMDVSSSSSSSSISSSSHSNSDSISSNGQSSEEACENIEVSETKILNDSSEKHDVLDFDLNESATNIFRIIDDTKNNPEIELRTKEDEPQPNHSKLLIEEISSDIKITEDELILEEANANSKEELITATLTEYDEEILENNSVDDVPNLEEESDDCNEELKATVTAIKKLASDTLDESLLESYDLTEKETQPQSNAQVDLISESSDYEPELEGKELMSAMELKSGKSAAEISNENDDNSRYIKEKSSEEFAYERKCEEINKKAENVLKSLSNDMDSILEELQKDKEERDAESQYKKKISDLCSESTTESQSEGEMLEELHKEKLIKKSISQSNKGVTNKFKYGQQKCSSHNQLVGSIDNIDMRKDLVNSLITEMPDIKITDYLTDQGQAIKSEVMESLNEMKNEEPNKAVTDFEKEANELRKLLRKLEEENEKLYNINAAYRRVLEEDIREEIKYKDKANDESSEKISFEIIDSLINDLNIPHSNDDATDNKSISKPKNYQFIDLESDEEFTYSDPPKPEEPIKKIGNVLTSFNVFVSKITAKNRETMLRNDMLHVLKEKQRIEREKRAKEEREKKAEKRKSINQELENHSEEMNEDDSSTKDSRPKYTDEEKAASLQKLLDSPYIKEFNEDTEESLDAQLESMRQHQKKKLRKMVDRVYAQKHKYDDTLELVDGKLVVVKKDSGEIEQLPQAKPYYSDDEDYECPSSDYDTALSEADNSLESKSTSPFLSLTSLPYKTKEPVSGSRLILQTLHRNSHQFSENENEEDDDQVENYHSFETEKQMPYDAIDEEFFNKLNFENIKLDENEEKHLVECAKSYEELKKFMEVPKEKRCLNDEENSLIDGMLEQTHPPKEPLENVAVLNSLTVEEDNLLKKMVERTKEKEKESNIAKESKQVKQEDPKRLVISQAKIYEYSTDTEETSKTSLSENTSNEYNLNDEENKDEKIIFDQFEGKEVQYINEMDESCNFADIEFELKDNDEKIAKLDSNPIDEKDNDKEIINKDSNLIENKENDNQIPNKDIISPLEKKENEEEIANKDFSEIEKKDNNEKIAKIDNSSTKNEQSGEVYPDFSILESSEEEEKPKSNPTDLDSNIKRKDEIDIHETTHFPNTIDKREENIFERVPEENATTLFEIKEDHNSEILDDLKRNDNQFDEKSIRNDNVNGGFKNPIDINDEIDLEERKCKKIWEKAFLKKDVGCQSECDSLNTQMKSISAEISNFCKIIKQKLSDEKKDTPHFESTALSTENNLSQDAQANSTVDSSDMRSEDLKNCDTIDPEEEINHTEISKEDLPSNRFVEPDSAENSFEGIENLTTKLAKLTLCDSNLNVTAEEVVGAETDSKIIFDLTNHTDGDCDQTNVTGDSIEEENDKTMVVNSSLAEFTVEALDDDDVVLNQITVDADVLHYENED